MGIARNLGAITFLDSLHSSASNHAFGPGKGALLPSVSPPALNGHWVGHPLVYRSGNGVPRVEHLVLTRVAMIAKRVAKAHTIFVGTQN